MTSTRLSMTRGDGRTFVLTLADEATFLAGDTVRFTAKRRRTDADADAVIIKTSPDDITFVADEATATVTIDPADTADLEVTTLLVFDWQVTASGGDPVTVERGTLLVRADVGITTP